MVATVYVDPYPGRKGSERVTETCGRCSGDGVVHYGNVKYQVRQVDGTSRGDRWCFWCNGAGTTSVLVSSARARERGRVKAAADAKAQQETVTARNAAAETTLREAVPGMAEALDLARTFNPMRSDDERKRALWNAGGEVLYRFRDGDLATVDEAAARFVELAGKHHPDYQAPAVGTVPEGRVVIEGELLGIKERFNDFGPVLKMLVEVTTDTGPFKVWGPFPAALSDAERGDTIRFIATVTPKEDGFGVFSHPTKATVVAKGD